MELLELFIVLCTEGKIIQIRFLFYIWPHREGLVSLTVIVYSQYNTKVCVRLRERGLRFSDTLTPFTNVINNIIMLLHNDGTKNA